LYSKETMIYGNNSFAVYIQRAEDKGKVVFGSGAKKSKIKEYVSGQVGGAWGLINDRGPVSAGTSICRRPACNMFWNWDSEENRKRNYDSFFEELSNLGFWKREKFCWKYVLLFYAIFYVCVFFVFSCSYWSVFYKDFVFCCNRILYSRDGFSRDA